MKKRLTAAALVCILSAGWAQNDHRMTAGGNPILDSLCREEPDVVATKELEEVATVGAAAGPKILFPRPGAKTGVLDPIVFGLCYTTAYEMLVHDSVPAKTYREKYARYLHDGYDFGTRHWKELVLRDFSSLRLRLRKLEEHTAGLEGSSFKAGALMGAYSANPDPELGTIDAVIADVLNLAKRDTTSSGEALSGAYDALFDEWLSFLREEKDRRYDLARHNRPCFWWQEYADDALIRPEWIDSAAVNRGVTRSEALASAVAKFASPAVPEAIRNLKAGERLTPDERNALLAPNEQISYAAGVVQAEWIMDYKWFVERDHRAEFDAVFLAPERRPAVIAAFEEGLRASVAIMEDFRTAIEGQDPDRIGLMHQAMKTAWSWAYRRNRALGYAFMSGMDAVDIYRAGAAWDIPGKQIAGGLELDVDKTIEGFGDYLDGRLNMGVEYAHTLTRGRNAVDWHLYETDTEDVVLSENDFQPARPIYTPTGVPGEWEALLPLLIETPQEIAGKGISGRVVALVVIEADGAVRKVEIESSPHPVLGETVANCICRMKFTPAMYRGERVASVARVPVLF
ncbi:energy transducer TonB [Alistipes sp.]|uniref:energy transducer TonB n=1 Tax=Alistipes sp. TaxID=1872444 RepID=UPI0025C18CE6|nr:energy transducer TonB [Alistipes sp.]